MEVRLWWIALLGTVVAGTLLLFSSTYWLLSQSLRDATRQTFDLGLPLFQQDVARLVAAEDYRCEVQKKHDDAISKTVLAHRDRAYWEYLVKSQRPEDSYEFAFFSITGFLNREICDLSLTCLATLDALLREIDACTNDFEAVMFVSPGTVLEHNDLLVLSARIPKSDVGTRQTSLDAIAAVTTTDITYLSRRLTDVLTGERTRDIQNLIDRLCEFRQVDATELEEALSFFERLGLRMQRCSRAGDSLTLKHLTDKYQCFLDLTAKSHEHQSVAKGMFRGWGASLSNPLELALADCVTLALESRDSRTVHILTSGFTRYFFVGCNHESMAIKRWSLDLLTMLYYWWGRRKEKVLSSSDIGELYDSKLDSILATIHSRSAVSTREARALGIETFLAEREHAYVVLGHCLSLVCYAVDHSEEDHVDLFVSRLGHYGSRSVYGGNYRDIAPNCEDVHTLHDITLVLAIGLALKPASSSDGCSSSESARRRLLREASKYLPSCERLVATWELYWNEEGGASVGMRLGADRLAMRSNKARPGRTTFGYLSDWEFTGFVAAALLAKNRESDDYFSDFPGSYPWDVEHIRSAAVNLASLPELELSEPERSNRINSLMSILEKRADTYARVELRSLAQQQIAEKGREELAKGIVKAWESERTLCRFIESKKGDQIARHMPVRARSTLNAPFRWLVSSNHSRDTIAQHLGRSIGFLEATRLMVQAEKMGQAHNELRSLHDLQDLIRAAKLSLTDTGYSPSLLVLPQNQRFLYALCRQPLWPLDVQNNTVQWEGMTVQWWPFSNPTSILVVDLHSAFGSTAEKDSEPECRIEPPGVEMREGFLETIEHSQPGEIKDLRDQLEATIIATLKCRLGVADAKAIMKIGIGTSNANYAMLSSAATYHRPWCPILLNHDSSRIELSMSPMLQGEHVERQPCQRCKPANWDVEAGIGEERCLGPQQ